MNKKIFNRPKEVKEFDDFIDLLASTKDKPMLVDLLYGVTTSKERREIARRVQVVQQLLEGHSQHVIADNLKVGIATVTRGSKELDAGRFKVLRGANV